VITYDSYKNENRYLFEIRETLVHKIKYNDGTIKNVVNNATFLVRAEINAQNNFIVYFEANTQVENEDQVYILIRYPGSDILKEVYAVSGRYYISNSSATLMGTLIEGESNESTLNNVGREYYAYAMVIKTKTATDTGDANTSNKSLGDGLKGFLSVVGIISIIVLILILIIKYRRKVRTV